jgi:EmrB/QacA subfamily drug resistance transporter
MQRKWWTLIAVSVATFMLLLDITVVNTALPSIRDDLGASFTDLQWVIDAYALTLAAFVLTAGSLADRLGRKRVFTWGLGIFTVASLLCAIAPDATSLNIARGLQGVGGAVMFAVSLALLAQEFRGREREMAVAAYGATIGIAVAIGPLVGGALTDAIGWESVFYLNVPVGLAAIAVTVTKLAESKDPNAHGIDWGGLVTFSAALGLLVLALLRGNDEGWGSTLIVSLLAAGGILLAAFVAIQRRVAQPMLPLGYFRNPAFTGAQIGALAISSSMFALFLYITLYMQNILGLTPLEAGLRYLPITIASFLMAPLAGAAMAKVPARVLMSIGLGMAGIGLLLMSGVDEGDTWTTLLGGFLIAGGGIGIVNPVLANVALSTVPDEQSGVASGINDTFRQVGVAVGVAGLGAVFLGRAQDHIAALLPNATSEQARGLAEGVSSGGLSGAPADVVAAARDGFLAGFNDILLIGAVIAIAGSLLVLLLVRSSHIRTQPVEVEAFEPVPEPVAA